MYLPRVPTPGIPWLLAKPQGHQFLCHLAPVATGLQPEEALGYPQAIERGCLVGKWAGGKWWGRSRSPALEPRDLSPNTCAPRINHASALQFSHLHNGTNR